MKIILSPAKKMRVQTDIMEETGIPVFLEEADELRGILSGFDRKRLKELFCANDSITELNYQRYQSMDLRKNLTPAVLAYVGLQYQTMAPEVFTDVQWEYVKENLRILSGFYGILRACDGVVPYRLEMQARLAAGGAKDLYAYWGDRLYRELARDDRTVLNLASREYSRAIQPYVEEDVRFISCVFGSRKGGKVHVRATAAKMARGEMVRWMALNQIQDPDDLVLFHGLDYQYCEELSTPDEYVFLTNCVPPAPA